MGRPRLEPGKKAAPVVLTVKNNTLAWVKSRARKERRSVSNMIACIMQDVVAGKEVSK